MVPQKIPSLTVGKAAVVVGLQKAILYEAIREGSLRAWRPWARGDLRINLDELNRWARGEPPTESSSVA